jgi:ATP-dependent helicase/nuclease subunit A
MTKWTTEQLEAIYQSGTNIIVSAGAGSGKTAVLTQRVIEKLKKGIHINELLILTFTNNAAAEMKMRIKKEILNNKEIIKEADLIETADITTFDAFVLSLVKKYHYYLNINTNISIIDASIIKKKKKDFINTIFESLYQDNNLEFLKFVSDFGTKNDKQIKQTILNLDYSFDLITEKEKFLETYVDKYYDINNLSHLFNEYVEVLIKRIETIKNLLYNLSFETTSEYYEKIESILTPLLNAKTYDEIRNNLNLKLPPARGTSEEGKYYKAQINEIIKMLKTYCLYDKEVLLNDLIETKKYTKIIFEIITKLNNEIRTFKFENQLFEFGDISKLAIKLIKEHEDVRNYLKNYYKEIMIDEYQDTSDIEEEFINLIENHNVYMVGDIKQSIYRFRNANPDIFKIKYDKYKNNENGVKIDLNKNFRSRGEVLDSINNIFNHIMDDSIGNANYQNEHQLIFGNNTFIENGNNNYNNDLEIYNYQIENKEFTKDEIEAFIIAQDINEKIKNKYQVFDDKLRPCTYKDFCILMDRSTSFDIYKKIFDYFKIPLNIYKDEDIMLSDEVLIINNIIGFIINIKTHIHNEKTRFYFTSIARSYLFNIPDQEIYDVIINNGINNTTIYHKCYEISKEIDYLSNKDILNLIINKFDIYQKMIAAGNIKERTTVINNLLEKFQALNSVGINIYGVNDYLNSLINDNESIKISAIITDSDSVTITNIHKSKGLEYKICYYSGLYKEFNTQDINKRIMYNNEYGLIIPNYNQGFISTFVNYLNKERYIKEEISERIRLFYVALTRCKEKMIILANLKHDQIETTDENGIIDYLTRISYKSFNDILNSCYKYIEKYKKDIPIPQINKNYKIQKSEIINNITTITQKIKVKELTKQNEIINEEHYSKNSLSLYTNDEIKNMELGTKMHYILEMLDFQEPDLSIYNDFEKQIIASLLKQPIMQNLNNAKIYKEYEFIYEDKQNIKHGIIDLMLEYDNYIDIIDYKLKNTTDKAYLNQLNGYKEFIKNKTNKNVFIYLYSLYNQELINLN